MGHIIADIILAVVALSMIFFYVKRGFLKSLIHSLKTVFALVIAYFLGGKLAQFISEKFISAPVRDAVFKKVDSIYQGAANSVDTDKIASSFPEFVMSDEVRAQIASAEGSGEQMVNTITDSIASPISNVISTVIGYVLVFVLAFIGLWIVASILDKIVDRFSILHLANAILGGVFGVLVAALLLFTVCSVIKFFFAESDFYTNSVLVKFFGESSILETVKFLDIGNLLS